MIKLENTLFFFNPDTVKIFPIENKCKNQTFTLEKSLNYYSEVKLEQTKFSTNKILIYLYQISYQYITKLDLYSIHLLYS